MKRKKIVGYIVLILCIVAVSIILPHGVRAITNLFVERVTETDAETEEPRREEGKMTLHPETEASPKEQTETEKKKTGKDRSSVSQDSSKETENRSELNASKEAFDERLQEYISTQEPEIIETSAGMKKMLVEDRDNLFSRSLAEHLFSLYEDNFTVTKIEIMDLLNQTDEEISCKICVYAKYGKKEYSEILMGTYYQNMNFYGFESYQ